MSEALIVHGVPVYARHGAAPVEAVGVRDGRVAAVGSLAQVRAAMPPSTAGQPEHRLDAGAVLPAFVDPHQHAYLVAADPFTDVLQGRATDLGGLLAAVAALVGAATPGEGWLRFHGYEPLGLTELRSPTAAELDRVCPDRPLHLISRTFHESVVNSAGLAALGIGAGTPDPPGGRILRDRRGRPTGVLLESAGFAAEARSRPDVDRATVLARLADHGRRLLAHGVTRIGEAALPVSVADAVTACLDGIGVHVHPLLTGARIDEPGFVEGGTAKVLADGGEYCRQCYTARQVRALAVASLRVGLGGDGPIARALGRRAGLPRRGRDGRWHTGIGVREGDLAALIRGAAEIGSALAVHATGNAAVEAVLRARAADPGAAAQVRVRVEHAMAADRDLARRLADAGLPVVTQPGFLPAYGRELSVVPLPAPLRLFPFRTLRDAGVDLAFSSDYPAADLDPWTAVAAAVTHHDRTGRAIHADETLELGQALAAHTEQAARVLGVPDAGTLMPGAHADLIWCDRDPYRVDVEQLPTIRTLATWRAGRLVHGAPASP